MSRRSLASLALAAVLLLSVPGVPARGGILRLAGEDGAGGRDVNTIVRQVTVAPARAHVGDVVSVEVILEDQGEPFVENAEVRILANGKTVASRLVTYGLDAGGSRIYRLAFAWDTRGAAPGEYRIRAEAFRWNDTSPFDNTLDVKQPLVLLARGTPIPQGEAGGRITETDPRFGKQSF